MSKMKTITALESILHAWDLYASGDFEGILAHPEYLDTDNHDLHDMRLLAELEVDGRCAEPGGDLFATLVRAKSDYFRGNLKSAASLLGKWLTEKEYHTKLIIDRFLESSFASESYSEAYPVIKKFVPIPAYRERLAEPLIRSAHHANLHRETIVHYHEHQAIVRDELILQKVALSMVRLGLFREAEKMLVHAFERYTGKPYHVRTQEQYENLKKEYGDRVSSLERKKNGTAEDVMDLGLAYLFNGRYDEALRLFESLKKRAA